jgi:hypothetical protein
MARYYARPHARNSSLESAAPDSELPEEEPASRVRLRRELVICGIACLAGFLIAPLVIWMVGHSVLGAYNPGGPGRLLADFMTGLAHGSPIFWAVALGPYALILLARLIYSQARGRR